MVKFGFGTIPMDLDSTISLISFAEKLGYDYAWMPDQTFYRDPYVMLGAVALKTKKIQLGVGVTNPYTRHPAMTARAVATVDELSKGRMNLGIGAGNRRELLIPLGYNQKFVADMCRDTAIITKRLFNGDYVTYEGKTVVKGIKLDFQARKNIPIYLAGRGPRILKYAGEIADGAIIGAFVGKEGMDYAFKQIKKGLDQSGRTFKDIDVVSWVGCTITDKKKEFIQSRKPSVAHIMGGATFKTLKMIGIEENVIESVQKAYNRGGSSKAAKYVTDEAIEKMSLFGTAEECTEKIECLFQQGIKQFSLLTGNGNLDRIKNTIEKFSNEVASNFT